MERTRTKWECLQDYYWQYVVLCLVILSYELIWKKWMTNKRQQNVDEALASFRNEGLEVDAYLQSQLNEYLAGRMTKKMMYQMVDEAFLEGKNDLLRYG